VLRTGTGLGAGTSSTTCRRTLIRTAAGAGTGTSFAQIGGSRVKVWNGSEWVPAVPRVWNGAEWVDGRNVKVYDYIREEWISLFR
jgi:hypothetical protein